MHYVSIFYDIKFLLIFRTFYVYEEEQCVHDGHLDSI